MNLPSIIVALLVVGMIVAILISIRNSKKKGKPHYGCSGCGACNKGEQVCANCPSGNCSNTNTYIS